MSISDDILTGRGKRRLTRADVEERLQLAGSSKSLDLMGEDITGSDLSNLSLSGANLSGANLSRATLSGADLIGANLSRASLSGADLIGANLSRASLFEANLKRANLSGANLSKATLSGANLSRASLSGTNLREANLREADLSGADLIGANIIFANLSRANLSRANLSGTNLREADLSGAKLDGTILDNAGYSENSSTYDAKTTEEKQEQQETEAISTLRIRIKEEPLTAPHLAETLDTLISLYVKMWLLQQGRFDDFLHYTGNKDRRFEEEVHLTIAELTYNSPADIKFNIDLSPKSLVEALQMLVDLIALRKQRKRAEELKLVKEQMSVLDQSLETAKHMVETIAPGLDEHQKGLAIQSVLADLHKLAQDPTLDISLTIAALAPQPQYKQIVEAKQSTAQPSEQTAP